MKTIYNNQLELNFDLQINDFECSNELEQQQAINQRIAEKREHNTTLSNLDFENYNYLYDTVLNIVDDITNSKYTQQIIIDNIDDREQLFEELNDYYWTNDNITGNGSGSWWFWTYPAQLAVFENLDLIEILVNEGYLDENCLCKYFVNGFESLDVAFRCYYLSEALNIVLDTFFEKNGIEA
jgi:hypothetical protein